MKNATKTQKLVLDDEHSMPGTRIDTPTGLPPIAQLERYRDGCEASHDSIDHWEEVNNRASAGK